MLIISHLVLHYWLVLELLEAKILLISCTHVVALIELLTLVPCGGGFLLLYWDFATLRLRLEILLLLSELLLTFTLTQFASLRIVLKPKRMLVNS